MNSNYQQQQNETAKQSLDYQQEAENEVDSITAGTVSSGVGFDFSYYTFLIKTRPTWKSVKWKKYIFDNILT